MHEIGRRGLLVGGLALVLLASLPTQGQVSKTTLFVSSSESGTLTRIDATAVPPSQTVIAEGLNTPEGISCGPEGRIFIAESALFQSGVGRRISRVDQDGTDFTVVLDFATTPELADSGGPEEPTVHSGSIGGRSSGLMLFNTRATAGGAQPHTGSWSATRTGENVRQVLLPFAGPNGNAEGSGLLMSGPFNGHFLAVDFPNNRVMRASRPFSQPQAGAVFIAADLSTPNGLEVDPLTGNVFVAETTGAIKRFSDTGTFLGVFGDTGFTNRKLDFDELGNLYVATVEGPVQRFSPAGGAPTTVGNVFGGNGIAACKTPGDL